ncbi:MAG TPA: L-2-amino-thiazoline-4-carboxylic acid hydrolase [bacterium]|nr:L-2-amino-thiazoline-4-carboxylic acid hydrolase [bacterium]
MPEHQLKDELYGMFRTQGLLYWHFFDSLRKGLGEERATAIMQDAIYQFGLRIGKRFARYAPDDLAGLRDAFLRFVPDGGASYQPEVLRCDADALDIKIGRCLLKDAWHAAGVSDADVMKLCRIAGRQDNGTFEGAGFLFSSDTWRPGRTGCCLMRIRPKK